MRKVGEDDDGADGADDGGDGGHAADGDDDGGADLVFMAVCRPTHGSSILFHSLQSDRGGGDQRALGWSQDAPGWREGNIFFSAL